MFKIFTIIIFMFIISCNSVETENNDLINIKLLTKEWKHSVEEQTDSIGIYRPSDYKEFQLLRYRQIYLFREDYTCKYLVLAPTDRHYFLEGKWQYESENQILEIIDSEGRIEKKFRIISLSENLLEILKID